MKTSLQPSQLFVDIFEGETSSGAFTNKVFWPLRKENLELGGMNMERSERLFSGIVFPSRKDAANCPSMCPVCQVYLRCPCASFFHV